MLRIRSAGTFALAVFFGLTHVVAVPQAQAQAADANRWGAWAELGGFLGSKHEDRAEAVIFLPLLQSEKGLFFTDVRGKLFEEQVSEVNAAFGYRHMHSSGWNFGGWLGADRRETSQDNIFWAAAGGLEAISENFDVRLNGYVAVSDPKRVSGFGPTTATIAGGQVFLARSSEVPLSGFDGEAGVRVPLEYLGIDSPRHGLRVYAGGFHFDDKDALENVAGPKARIEWRIDDVLAGIPGSRLAMETEWRSDEVRGGHVEAGVRFRLPFSIFRNSGSRSSEQPVQWRRMMDGLERDTDIVTGRREERERVADVLTGVAFDRVVDVNAATGVTDPAAAAGGNTLLVADGSGGAIDGPQALQANQTLLGGGGSIQVRGVESGVVATLTAPGQAPTFTNSADVASLTLADRTHLAAVSVTGKTANVNNTGVLLGSDQFAVLQDVRISGVGRDGVEGVNRNTVRLIDVNVADTPNGFGVGFVDGNRVTVERGVFDGGLVGMRFNDGNTFTIADTMISGMGNTGVQANNNNVATLTGVRISDTGSDGVEFNDGNMVTVTDTSVSNAASNGFEFDDGNTVTVAGASVSNVGFDGFDFRDNNVVSVDGADIFDTGFDGLSFRDGNDATITDVTIRTVGFGGLSFLDLNTATVTGMTLSDTGADGIAALDDNVLTISGSTITDVSSAGVNVVDRNTVTVSDTSMTDITGDVLRGLESASVTVSNSILSQRIGSPFDSVLDLRDNATLVISGSTLTGSSSALIDVRANGNVTINQSTFNGSPSETINITTGSTLSGSGNVDNTTPTTAFCDVRGAPTGQISFIGGATCP